MFNKIEKVIKNWVRFFVVISYQLEQLIWAENEKID